MSHSQSINELERLENQPEFRWIDDVRLRSQLWVKVQASKALRSETQKELSSVLHISLTKIKEIEKGKCKDFNATNNYINYFGVGLDV